MTKYKKHKQTSSPRGLYVGNYDVVLNDLKNREKFSKSYFGQRLPYKSKFTNK